MALEGGGGFQLLMRTVFLRRHAEKTNEVRRSLSQPAESLESLSGSCYLERYRALIARSQELDLRTAFEPVPGVTLLVPGTFLPGPSGYSSASKYVSLKCALQEM